MNRTCFPRLHQAIGKIVSLLALWLIAGLPCGNPALAEEVAILQSAEIRAYSEAIQAYKAHLPPSFTVGLEYNLQGDMAKGRSLARRIRASDADVVLAVGLKAALAAKLEILDIPVIFCLVLDPAQYGLPAKNMVGLSLDIPFDQQLKSLQSVVPKLTRLGVLYDPEKTQGMQNRLKQEAESLGLEIIAQEVGSEQEVASGLRTLGREIDALWLLPDSTVLTESTLDFLVSTTLEANIPVYGFSSGLVQSGVVVGTYLKYSDIGQQAATLSQHLFETKPPPPLGTMIQAEKIHRSINKKSAKFLGYSLSPHTLRIFDEHF